MEDAVFYSAILSLPLSLRKWWGLGGGREVMRELRSGSVQVQLWQRIKNSVISNSIPRLVSKSIFYLLQILTFHSLEPIYGLQTCWEWCECERAVRAAVSPVSKCSPWLQCQSASPCAHAGDGLPFCYMTFDGNSQHLYETFMWSYPSIKIIAI